MVYIQLMRRIAITLLLCLMPLSALAARGDENTSSCQSTTARDVGRCSMDTMKRWSREIREFERQLKKERDEWHLTHDILGVTPELTKELQAFSLEQQRRMKVFKLQLQNQQQSLEKDRRKKEVTTPKAAATARPNASAARFEEGMKICSKFTSVTLNRACMKPYLRIVDLYGRTGLPR